MFGPNPPRLSIFGRVARARRVVAVPLRVVTRVATSARERVIVIARGVAIASFLRRRVVSRRVASARFRGPRGAARAREGARARTRGARRPRAIGRSRRTEGAGAGGAGARAVGRTTNDAIERRAAAMR